MNRSLLLAVAGAVALSSTVHAGFTIGHTRTSAGANFDRITLNVTNTGGATGINAVAFDLGGYGIPALPSGAAGTQWNVDEDGKAVPFGSFTSTSASAVRVTTAANTQHISVYQTPASWGEAGLNKLDNWGLVFASTTSAASLNNNTNFNFASILVDKNAGMHFDIRTAGSIGQAVGLVYDVPAVGVPPTLDITGTGSASAGTQGGNSYFISATGTTSFAPTDGGLSVGSLNAGVNLQLVGDLQKAQAAGATITPENGGLRVNFSPTRAGDVYNLSFRATDALGASTVETLSLKTITGVAPEPASLASLVLAGAMLRRRRTV